MKKENKYLHNLSKGFENSDIKLIEDTLWDFYYKFYEIMDTKEEEKYDIYETELLQYLYSIIINERLPKKEIAANYDLINERMLYFIVQPFWEKLIKMIKPEILNATSKNDPGENNGENLLTELNYLAEYIFFRHDYEISNKQFIRKELIDAIEEQLVAFSNLILMGCEKFDNTVSDINDNKMLKKFQGNSLAKRKNSNEKNYKRVAKILKVADDTFAQLKISQKTACEIVNCNEFSFARWKNYNNNFDLFLKWQGEMSEDEIETIKKEIRDHLKLHSDM